MERIGVHHAGQIVLENRDKVWLRTQTSHNVWHRRGILLLSVVGGILLLSVVGGFLAVVRTAVPKVRYVVPS